MSDLQRWREELVVNLEGGNADKHEIDAAVLGRSLQSLSSFVTRTSNIVYGKGCNVNVKIKGSFREGSFDYTIVMDFFTGFVPIIHDISKVIFDYIDLLKFIKGEKPQKIEPVKSQKQKQDQEQFNMGNSINVTNSNGETKVFAPIVLFMCNNWPIKNSFDGILAPLGEGAEAMTFSSPAASSSGNSPNISEESASITTEEKKNMLKPDSETISSDDIQRTLEVLTPHMDGKPKEWRFYDLDDEVEYYANIGDNDFLENVRERKLIFHHGSKISATVNVTKKLVKERKRTIRTLTNITVLPDENTD